MPPEANIPSVMRQCLNSVTVRGLHSSDERSAGFDVRISLVAAACTRCLLPRPRRCSQVRQALGLTVWPKAHKHE